MDAIGTLDAYSFITKRAVDQAFDLHRLVHLATRRWLTEKDLISEWATRTTRRLAEVFPNHDHNNRAIWRVYLSTGDAAESFRGQSVVKEELFLSTMEEVSDLYTGMTRGRYIRQGIPATGTFGSQKLEAGMTSSRASK